MTYRPDTIFLNMHNLWLDLLDMTLDQGNDTPLGHEDNLCMFKSNYELWLREDLHMTPTEYAQTEMDT